jgi:hypothetical protein
MLRGIAWTYRMMISTRLFWGSRTPGPVGTSRCVSPKPWIVMAAGGKTGLSCRWQVAEQSEASALPPTRD